MRGAGLCWPAPPEHGLPWSRDDVLSDILLKKTDFPFPSSCQLQTASWPGVGHRPNFLRAVQLWVSVNCRNLSGMAWVVPLYRCSNAAWGAVFFAVSFSRIKQQVSLRAADLSLGFGLTDSSSNGLLPPLEGASMKSKQKASLKQPRPLCTTWPEQSSF